MRILAPELRSEARWLSSGFMLMLYSGFGQTYFIAIFAGQLKGELEITDGEFGGLYTAGTLASAALLAWAGKLADSVAIRWLGAGVIGGLALTSIGMASVTSPWMLGFVLFGLRFFGQGMLSHTATTAMARWFNRKRGRAVSIASLGMPAGEALLPPLAVAAVALLGWRETWLAAAALLLFVAAPTIIVTLKHERHPTRGPLSSADGGPTEERPQWTRPQVLRHPVFYALLPGLLAPSFIVTAIFFNQVTLVSVKGWPLAWFAAAFPLLAGVHIVSALAAGWLVDRAGSWRLLPLYLLPLGIAALILTFASSASSLLVVMSLIGFTMGFSSATSGALWAELYGTTHLGAIRAVSTAVVVLASALAPGLVGVLLDAGIALEAQLLVMGIYCFIAALWMLVLQPSLGRLAAA